MQLRSHPSMIRHGVSNWPPFWTYPGTGKNGKIIRDEIGILKHVQDGNSESNKLHLVIEYQKEHYVGSLVFDDIKFHDYICRLLKLNLGRSIAEIGDLNIGGD
jgi:hypothetical protein